MRLRLCGFWVVFCSCATSVQAGLYYSGEHFADLPSQWRGFLLDQRLLRNIALRSTTATADGEQAGPLRARYLEEASRLDKQTSLGPDDIADLGALHLRLGDTTRALAVLRPAQRKHPNHFRLAANLGTAWQLHGDLAQAALALQEAVRLAPGKFLAAEELHLKLVQQRSRKGPNDRDLDDLFGIRYAGERGELEPGKLDPAERKKLPARAVALVQQLALWLPADGRLLWQLAELANAHGDVKTAAAMMDGCVTSFNMASPELRRRRHILRAASEALASKTNEKAQHEQTHQALAFRSKRPLPTKLDSTPLPPVSDSETNVLPWDVLAETTVDRKYRPTFPRYLQELAGKEVTLSGFMQPLRDDTEGSAFMFIEYPVGCWYCETPETTGIIYVQLAPGTTASFRRSLVRVTGRLTLNASDPEDFLFAVRQARIASAD